MSSSVTSCRPLGGKTVLVIETVEAVEDGAVDGIEEALEVGDGGANDAEGGPGFLLRKPVASLCQHSKDSFFNAHAFEFLVVFLFSLLINSPYSSEFR